MSLVDAMSFRTLLCLLIAIALPAGCGRDRNPDRESITQRSANESPDVVESSPQETENTESSLSTATSDKEPEPIVSV